MYLIHRMTKGALILTLAGGMAAVTFAEDARTQTTTKTQTQQQSQIKMNDASGGTASMQQQEQRQLMMASALLDKDVKNRQGETIGEIEDLVLSADRSRVSYAVLGTGGAMDMGETFHAVPFAALQITPPASRDQEATVVLDLPASTFQNRQGIGDNWPEQGAQDLVPQSRRQDFERQQRQATSDRNVFQRTGQALESGARATGEALRKGAHKTGEVIESAGEGIQNMTDGRDNSRTADATGTTTTRTETETRRTTTASATTGQSQGISWTRKVEEVADANLHNLAKEDLGDTDDLVIDINSGRVVYAVVAYGGTLGMNESKALVPWAAIDIAPGSEDTLQIDLNRAELNRLAWSGDGDIDFNDQQYVSRVQTQFQDVDWQVYGYDKDETKSKDMKSNDNKSDLKVKTKQTDDKTKIEVERQ